MKLANLKDWKTTVLAVIGAVLVIAGMVWPEKVDVTTQEVIKSAVNEIVIGLGTLIAVIPGLFGKGE